MELRDQDVSVRMLIRVLPLLEKLHSSGTTRDTAANRTLFFDDYAKLTLVYLLNPLIDSISMLQRAAALPKLARQLGKADVHTKRTRKGYINSSGQMPLLCDDLSLAAELISLLYRYRWTIEVFFKFLKQLLGCRHLISQRRNGVQIQIYCAMIACMLLNLQTGLKPTKAVMEILMWHMLGFADQKDVQERIEKTRQEQQKARSCRSIQQDATKRNVFELFTGCCIGCSTAFQAVESNTTGCGPAGTVAQVMHQNAPKCTTFSIFRHP